MAVKPLNADEETMLEALSARKGAGEMLDAAERLLLRELLARKGATAWIAKVKAVEERKRKASQRLAYQRGGLVVRAGLGDWSDDELLGLLLRGARTTAAERQDMAREGRACSPKQQGLRISFPQDKVPPKNLLTGLHRRKFVFDEQAKCWTGTGNLAEITEEAALAGGTVEVIGEAAAVT